MRADRERMIVKDIVRLLRRQLADAVRLALHPSARRQEKLAALHTIAEVRDAARKALPKVIFDFVDGGSGDEITLRRNEAAFDQWSIVPRFLRDVSDVDTTTTILGTRVPVPIMGGPAGLLGLINKEGEGALAAAMAAMGSVYSLPAMSSLTIEEVRAAAPDGRLWFQTYLWRDRGVVLDLLERAAAAKYEALVVTVDVPRSSDRRRDRLNKFGLPPKITGRTLFEGITHPRWTKDFLLHPRITAANVRVGGAGSDAVSVAAYIDRQFDPSATWQDFEWLRANWSGPIIVKGILSPVDARRAVDLGAQAVAVSNHGGRQFDHAPATMDVLPDVVAEVGADAEIYVDGGIRRGSDIIKAIALGAQACMIARPLVYGLGIAGRQGAEAAVNVLANELRTALVLSGHSSVAGLSPEILRTVPAGSR